MFNFDCDGLALHSSAADPLKLLSVLASVPPNKAGARLRDIPGLLELLGAGSVPMNIARSHIGQDARPVRAILFNKSPANNWPLGWHQDRTIAVAARHDVPGFAHWTIKSGVQHVEPPTAVLGRMVTLRVHLDDVDANNAPLRVAVGSHRLGLIPEQDYAGVIHSRDEHVCRAKAGDIWAYSTLILHASAAAIRPSRRRVLQVDYAADDLPEPLEWAGV